MEANPVPGYKEGKKLGKELGEKLLNAPEKNVSATSAPASVLSVAVAPALPSKTDAPTPDKTASPTPEAPPPLKPFTDINGDTAPIVYQLKAPRPVSIETIALELLGNSHDNLDEFSRRERLHTLECAIGKRIRDAKSEDLYRITESVELGEYDFDKNTFPTKREGRAPTLLLVDGKPQELMFFARTIEHAEKGFYVIHPINAEKLADIPVKLVEAESFAPTLRRSRSAEISYIGTLVKCVETRATDEWPQSWLKDFSQGNPIKIIGLKISEMSLTLKSSGQSISYKLPKEDTPAPIINPISPPILQEVIPAAIPVARQIPSSAKLDALNAKRLTAYGISNYDHEQVQQAINTIYARYGAELPKKESQAWADRQDWYHRVPGRTPENAEELFTENDRANIELLATQRDALRKNPDYLLRVAASNFISSGNAVSIDRELEPYAEQVDYFDKGIKTKTEIRADIAAEHKRWTARRYTVSKVVETQYDAGKDEGRAIVHFTFEVSHGTKQKTGEAESLIVFRSMSKDPKVISVKDHKFK